MCPSRHTTPTSPTPPHVYRASPCPPAPLPGLAGTASSSPSWLAKQRHAEAPCVDASAGSCVRAACLSSGHRPVLNENLQIRLLGLWSCVGKGEIRHDERLAIDMKFSPAAAFLIGFSQRSFVWEMTGGSLRRLTPSGADVNFKLRCAAPVLSLCSRTESLHLAGLPVSWFFPPSHTFFDPSVFAGSLY